jgi:hypothetical protein
LRHRPGSLRARTREALRWRAWGCAPALSGVRAYAGGVPSFSHGLRSGATRGADPVPPYLGEVVSSELFVWCRTVRGARDSRGDGSLTQPLRGRPNWHCSPRVAPERNPGLADVTAPRYSEWRPRPRVARERNPGLMDKTTPWYPDRSCVGDAAETLRRDHLECADLAALGTARPGARGITGQLSVRSNVSQPGGSRSANSQSRFYLHARQVGLTVSAARSAHSKLGARSTRGLGRRCPRSLAFKLEGHE